MGVGDNRIGKQGSTLAGGGQLFGVEGGDAGEEAAVPQVYGLYSISNDTKIGFGINSPFGLVTDYDASWVGRYNEVTTSLKTVNLNVGAAHRLSGKFSVGGGLNFQYARATFIQAVDFATVCAALGGNCGAPQTNDGRAKVKGDILGYGFNLGALYELTPKTRFGAHYRSRINYNVKGEADFDTPASAAAFFTAAGVPSAFTDTPARFDLTTPEIASISAFHQIDDKWAIMGDVRWTRWGQFPWLRIEYDNSTPDTFIPTDWRNVFRYSAGASYKWSEKLTLRAGLAFDDSPISGDFRGPGIPDSDRIEVAIGLGYAISDRLWMDAGYQHLFFKTGNARRISGTGSTLNGDFNINVDVLGVVRTPEQ